MVLFYVHAPGELMFFRFYRFKINLKPIYESRKSISLLIMNIILTKHMALHMCNPLHYFCPIQSQYSLPLCNIDADFPDRVLQAQTK